MVVGDEETRNRILDNAARLMFRDGYAATTMQKIAKHAGVELEVVGKMFASKYQLVRAIRDRALFESARWSAEMRSDAVQARESDPREIFRQWAELAKEVSPRVSPVLLLIRDNAATDRDMADLQRVVDEERLQRMSQNATRFERFGIDPARSRDVMWVATSPELYELLVVKRGWSVEQYGAYIEQMLAGTLLP
jgi:AcrR family transcriptional regulator